MKKVYFVFIVFIFLAWCFPGCSQKEKTVNAPEVNFAIDGYVRQSVTDEKVPDVIVSVAGQVCTTNVAGYYYFNAVPAGTYHLTAEKFGSALFENDITVDRASQYDFKVNYDVSLYGWVTHPVDGPIAGATVQAGDSTAVTSRTGYYEFVGLDPGTYSLACEKEGYKEYESDVTLDGDFNESDIGLERSFVRIYGIISSSAGGPLANAIVRINDVADTTSTDGYYSIDGISYGMYTIYCQTEGSGTVEMSVDIDRDYFELNVEVDRLYSISGVVYHVVDGPLEGVTVSVGDFVATTDGNGYYLLNVPEGVHEIMCTHPDYNESIDTIDVEYSQSLPSIRMLKTAANVELDITDDLTNGIERSTFCSDNCMEPNDVDIHLTLGYGWAGTDDFCGDLQSFSMPYLKFESVIFDNLINADSTYLRLYVAGSFGVGNIDCIRIQAITDSWEEGTVTCDNIPSVSNIYSICIEAPEAGPDGFVDIDITDLMNMNPNPFFGIRLFVDGFLGGTVYAYDFYSSEYNDESKRPKVIGTFTY